MLLTKIANRSKYPVKLRNGETVYVKSLSIDQLEALERIPEPVDSRPKGQAAEPAIAPEAARDAIDGTKPGYLLGCCLCDEKGLTAFAQREDESDSEFGNRVWGELRTADVGLDVVKQLQNEIWRVTNFDADAIRGN